MKHFLDLVLNQSYTELKSEAGQYYAGFLWWILEPIIFMFTFYLVFGIILKHGGEHYVASLLCGLTVWKWFSSSVAHGSQAITRNQYLLQMIYVKKFLFPAASLISNFFRFLIIFSLLIIFLIVYGIYPDIRWSALPLVIFIQFLFTIGCTTFAAALVPFFPDMSVLIDKLLTLLLFLSGVVFEISQLPEKIQYYFYFNPLGVIVASYKQIFLYEQWPDVKRLSIIGLISIGITIAALYILNRNDHLYPKMIV